MSDDISTKNVQELIQGSDFEQTDAALREELQGHLAQLQAIPEERALERARVQLEIATALLGLRRTDEAWTTARAIFDVFVALEAWQEAVESCEILYQCEKGESIPALGIGIWLGITFSVRPETVINLLHHVVDETPDDSDGGAVAAMAAHYIADVHAEGQERENLKFLTSEIVGRVAKRHRNIEDQATLDVWLEMYNLNDPAVLFKNLGKILEVMIGERWWFDKEAVRAKMAAH
ncbi:hypothetical protein [Endothiovibrio diazotrophicus]